MARDHHDKKAWGDFQTPKVLAGEVVRHVAARRSDFASVFEPSCGLGAFLDAAREHFPRAQMLMGLEINPSHLKVARSIVDPRITLLEGDVFSSDLDAALSKLPDPLLLLGNPPWVTSADQGRRGSNNLPAKNNLTQLKGLDARTGRANFDVSEWMLIHLLERVRERNTSMAVLIKTSVARRILAWAWARNFPLANTAIHQIDAEASFGATVDACLFSCDVGPASTQTCRVYSSLEGVEYSTLGWVNGNLVSDVVTYQRLAHLAPVDADGPRWRSGIKHDAAKLLELVRSPEMFTNGLGEHVALEEEHVFPLLKATDLAHGRVSECTKWILVPQRSTRVEPAENLEKAPRVRSYLEEHAAAFDRRGSSIYKKRPRFSIFGVGPYSFAPFKIATSGLHKKLAFHLVEPIAGRPVLFDDTCYFLPFEDLEGARRTLAVLSTAEARDFLSANIFWDAKRPITADILRRLGLPLR